MAKTVDVIGTKNTAELPAELFDVQTNIPLIHQVVVAQQAAARQGTHATKTRGMVAGGGAKPWRQKGTGRARQGSRRAPQFTGGGTVHGPQPRDYAQRTPKKMIQAALRGALSDRAREGRLHVVAEIAAETPSTKAALQALASIESSKVLVVLDRSEDVAWLSLRNVPTVHALAVDQLNAYDVLVNDDVVFTSAALATFVASAPKGRAVAQPAAETKADEPAKAKPAKGAKAEAAVATAEAKPAKAAKAEAAVAAAEAKPAKADKPVKAADEAKPAKGDKAPKAEKEPKPAKAAAAEKPAKPEAAKAEAVEAPAEAKSYGKGSYVGENPPKGYDIKGNADSMKYHTPESPWYGRTVAEVWFNSTAAAEKAGFVNAVKEADK